jgi:hypothetical protein
VIGVGFSNDGERLFSAADDRTVRFWDTTTGQLVVVLTAPGAIGGTAAALSPDGSWLAYGNRVGLTILWDARPGPVRRVFVSGRAAVISACLSPDERHVAAGADDTSVRVWDALTGREVLLLSDHDHAVHRLAFTADGGRLASGSLGGRDVAWEVPSGRAVPAVAAWEDAQPRLPRPDGACLTISDNHVRLIDRGRPGADEIARRMRVMGSDWRAPDPAYAHSSSARSLAAVDRRSAGAFFHLRQKARVYAELGDWTNAQAAFSGQPFVPPEQAAPSQREQAMLFLAAGRLAEYRSRCAALLKLCQGQEPGGGEAIAEDVARACAPRADALPPEGWQSLAGKRIEDATVRAAVLCRAGRHAQALEALASDTGAYALLVRALAEQGLGRADAAREALRQAAAWLDAAPDPPRWDGTKTRAALLPWDRRVELDALRREAESALRRPAP